MRSLLGSFLLLPGLLAVAMLQAHAQQSSVPGGTAPPWLSSLTPEQKALFDSANASFSTNDFSGALPKLRQLHEQVPQNDTITKYLSESAVNTGDFALASSLLEPILRNQPDDPQALGIEAHLYGQQHDVTRRDSVLDHIQKLHDGGKPAPATVVVEKVSLPDGTTIRISDYVEPRGRFHIVLMAETYDASGQRIRRTALESDDIDQVRFRQDHPDQADAGVRIYSMDSYTETRNAQGQLSGGTHGTLCPVPGCFMTGRPSYELFRSTVLDTNKVAPTSQTIIPSK